MNVKAFEIRDKGTFIAALGILMVPNTPSYEAERYLLRRAGYGEESLVLLCRMEAAGPGRNASYDPYGWGDTRTMTVAHQYIQDHWDDLESGAVICVEHILDERPTPKTSERLLELD